LEKTKVKAKRTKKDQAWHNSGGTRRAITTMTFVDDESSRSYNSNNRKFGWKILSAFAMVIKTYNIQLPENLMYLGLHPPKRGKITSMWKISFNEHLSSPHWPMGEQKIYTQVQIMHRCVLSSLWVKLIEDHWPFWLKLYNLTNCI